MPTTTTQPQAADAPELIAAREQPVQLSADTLAADVDRLVDDGVLTPADKALLLWLVADARARKLSYADVGRAIGYDASTVSRRGRGAGRSVSPIQRASACAAPTSANVPSARAVRMRHIDAPSAVRRHFTPPGAVKSTDFTSAPTATAANRQHVKPSSFFMIYLQSSVGTAFHRRPHQ